MATENLFLTRETQDDIIGGLIAGGGALSMYGAYQAGERAFDTYAYNKDALELDAKRVGFSGALQQAQFKRYATDYMAKQQAQVAGSGFAMSGTIVDVLADTQEQLALKALDLEERTRQQQEAIRQRAKTEEAKGRAARRSAKMQMATTGIATALKLIDIF